MRILLYRSQIIGAEGEVPITAVILDNLGRCIGHGSNTRNKEKNPMGHAEIAAISQASWVKNDWRLNDCTLIVTLEPCTMCAAAISEAHISTVYFGAYDEKNGGVEKLRIAFNKNNIFVPDIYGGICESQSKKMLKNFFKNNRK